MRIFICWSQGRSKRLAEALAAWLPSVVEGLDPFLSSDIEKGERWFERISEALRESQAGLVCLTPENLSAPWIHFEAGALATAVNGRIFTYLHRVDPKRLAGPLAEFQSTQTTREDTLRLVTAIARAANVTRVVAMTRRFVQEWPALEAVIRELDAIAIDTVVPDFESLFLSKTFTEPMRRCRDHSWGRRYERLARVDTRLKEAADDVSALGLPHLEWLYQELLRQLDRYIMGISMKELLAPREFPPGADGYLDIPKNLLDACEDPRIRVQQLKDRLLSTASAPVLAEAVQFQGLDTDQKREMVAQLERRGAASQQVLGEDDMRRALGSFWDYDRIASYVVLALKVVAAEQVRDCAHHVRHEMELVAARKVRSSFMPLEYALRALGRGLQRVPAAAAADEVIEVVEDLDRFVAAAPEESRKKIAVSVMRIRERLGSTAPESPASSVESTEPPMRP